MQSLTDSPERVGSTPASTTRPPSTSCFLPNTPGSLTSTLRICTAPCVRFRPAAPESVRHPHDTTDGSPYVRITEHAPETRPPARRPNQPSRTAVFTSCCRARPAARNGASLMKRTRTTMYKSRRTPAPANGRTRRQPALPPAGLPARRGQRPEISDSVQTRHNQASSTAAELPGSEYLRMHSSQFPPFTSFSKRWSCISVSTPLPSASMYLWYALTAFLVFPAQSPSTSPR